MFWTLEIPFKTGFTVHQLLLIYPVYSFLLQLLQSPNFTLYPDFFSYASLPKDQNTEVTDVLFHKGRCVPTPQETLSLWLYSPSGPWPLFQFLNTQEVGLL
jgi:hypothetical protein